MSSKAAANVREKFVLEFVTADSEVAALKSLFKKVDALPQLVLFDSEETNVVSMNFSASEAVNSGADESGVFSNPVDEVEDLCALFSAAV